MNPSYFCIKSPWAFQHTRLFGFFKLWWTACREGFSSFWPIVGALLFPYGAFAVTLGEVTAATAVSGALQNTAQTHSKGAIQKAKQAVQQYESAQQQRLRGGQGDPAVAGSVPASANPNPAVAGSVPTSANPNSAVAGSVPTSANPNPAVAGSVPTVAPSDSRLNKPSLENPGQEADRAPSMHGTLFSQNEENPLPSLEDPTLDKDDNRLRNMTLEELSKELKDPEIQDDIDLVDYKRSVQVFYKNKCPRSATNCVRGAVFTNIKSVIFDYARSRAGFAKK